MTWDSQVQTLVIGFGNEWRGDDALGPEVARRIAARRFPGVHVKTVHQLTPELAEDLSKVTTAIFVDASVDPVEESIAVQAITAAGADSLAAHFCEPQSLLALSEILYGRTPQAWMISIRGETFEGGAPLSATALRRAAKATDRVEALLGATGIVEEPR